MTGAAFVAGFIDAIAGGGGLFLLPSFLLAGLPPQTALGTNKFVATCGTAAAVGNFFWHKKINLKILAAGIFSAIFGAFLGAKIILIFMPEIVGKIIAFLLPVAILVTFLPRKKITEKKDFSRADFFCKIPAICAIVGFYDGFFGPGTGTFLALGFYFFLKMPLLRATANAKIFNFLSNFGALFGFILAKKVLFFFALPLVAASILGNFLGSKMAIFRGEKFIKIFLAISLTILFFSLIFKFFGK